MEVFHHNIKVINGVFISCINDRTQTKLIKAKTYWQTKWMFDIKKIFSSDTFLAKSIIQVREYTEMNGSKHENWQV